MKAMLLILLLASVALGEFAIPNRTVNVEITHQYMLLPISFGGGVSTDNKLIASYSLFVNKYVAIMGDIWLNPYPGSRTGIFFAPQLKMAEVNFSEDFKGSFMVVPFAGISMNSGDDFFNMCGIKLLFLAK